MADEPKKPITEEQIDWEEELPEWKDEPAPKVGSADELLRQWEREQWEKFHPEARRNHDGAWNDEEQPFETIDASTWHGQQRPVREFLDERKLIPFGYATNLSGAGAVGKTLIALQASVSCVTGTKWLNAPIRQGSVLFYSAEEPLAEMHIRLDEISEAENMRMDRLKGLHIIDLNNVADASLIAGDNRTGKVKMTSLFGRLEKTIAMIRPVVVWLDNRGLLVTGNENDRAIASMAMRALQLMAEKYRCSIILLSHPSLTGMNSGTGSSGSTAWFNTGRSTLYMSKPTDDDGVVTDEDVRVLENNKANYAKHGTKVNLKWEFNRFICTDPPPRPGDTIGKHDKAEAVFMRLMEKYLSINGRWLSPSRNSQQYAPKIFDQMPAADRDGFNIKWFRMALDNLLYKKRIRIEMTGRKAHEVQHLVFEQ